MVVGAMAIFIKMPRGRNTGLLASSCVGVSGFLHANWPPLLWMKLTICNSVNWPHGALPRPCQVVRVSRGAEWGSVMTSSEITSRFRSQ